MRFFTKDFIEEEKTSDDHRRLWEEYRKHLHDNRDVLTAPIQELALLPGVDDGLIVSFRHNRDVPSLELILRCGDLIMGYFDLCLEYIGRTITASDEAILQRLADLHRQNIHGDIAYHEVDTTADGAIVHRILFHGNPWSKLPSQEVEITCRTLRWQKIPRPNRDL